tara:strand:+ start:242 stop:1249 length:1008 start_codon:yes stop_codon:yes gene_type:complete
MDRIASLTLALIFGFSGVGNLIAATQEKSKTKKAEYTREEYDAYQKAIKLTDQRARINAMKQFIAKHPSSMLVKYARDNFNPVYIQWMNQLYKKKDLITLGAVAEEFLKMRPGHEAGLAMAFEAYYQNKNYRKAANYGEALYGKKPSNNLARLLAYSFDQLKNQAKFISYTQKFVGTLSPKEGFYFNAKLSYYYAKRKNISRAASYCQKMLAAYGGTELPPGYDEAKWRQEKGRIYSITGRNHYERKRYRQALVAYQNSLRLRPRDDEAYYYMGMSNWGAEDTTTAMKNLAKAYSLNSGYAKVSRAQLEVLYKAINKGSLDGLDRLMRAAASELP